MNNIITFIIKVYIIIKQLNILEVDSMCINIFIRYESKKQSIEIHLDLIYCI